MLRHTCPMIAAITMKPPVRLAMDGTSLKQTQTHATASGVASVRGLGGRDRLASDGKEHQPQAELSRARQTRLSQVQHRDIEWFSEWPDEQRAEWCR